jgi:hypothetical protein
VFVVLFGWRRSSHALTFGEFWYFGKTNVDEKRKEEGSVKSV